MSLSKWFASQRAAHVAKDDKDDAFYLRDYAQREAQKDFQHSHDDSAKRAGARRPLETTPRADMHEAHTRNDGSKRSS